MKRAMQFAALAAALACVAIVASVAARGQGHGKTPINPAVTYSKNCATCHGKDGRAKTFKAKFNHARDLTNPGWQAGVTDEHLFNSISNGKGKRPAWGKKFSEAEINALVAYVRSLKK